MPKVTVTIERTQTTRVVFNHRELKEKLGLPMSADLYWDDDAPHDHTDTLHAVYYEKGQDETEHKVP